MSPSNSLLAVSAALCFALIPSLSTAQDAKKAKPTASQQMHQAMVKGAKQSLTMKPSGDIDRDFLTMMRQHHQTGIQMAEHEMLNGKDDKVKELARRIAEGRKEEAKELEQLAKASRASAGTSK